MCAEAAPPNAAKQSLALVLSGRPDWAGFHLGAILRLGELGLLPQVKLVSGAAGSELLVCNLLLAWPRFAFGTDGAVANLRPTLLDRLPAAPNASKLIMRRLWWSLLRNQKVLPLDGPACKRFAANSLLEPTQTLGELPGPPAAPELLLSLVSWQTGSLVCLHRQSLEDPRVGRIALPDIPLAQLAAISTGMPVAIDCDPRAWRRIDGRCDLYDQRDFRSTVVLTAAGVVGSLGFEHTDRHPTDLVLVSDATGSFQPRTEPIPGGSFRALLKALSRANELAVRDSTRTRRAQIAQAETRRGGNVVSWTISGRLADYEIDRPVAIDTDATDGLDGRVDAVDPGLLLNWGYVQADAALRQAGLDVGRHRPTRWPAPEAAPHALLSPS